MNKSLLALAVLGAFAGTVSAQSSVTIGGTMDLAARHISNQGRGSVQVLAPNGLSTSALRFFGTEDMGGGLKAGFWLEAAVNPDTGTAEAAKFWGRRSTVSLIGRFGEVRLGRDYTPTFWNTTVFDPFGTNGVGNSRNVANFGGVLTNVRADNSIGYFLPAMGGIYGQAMAAAGEGDPNGKYIGARVGFASGPINVAVAVGRQDMNPTIGRRFNNWNVGASYDLGMAKLMAFYNHEKNESTAVDENRMLLGVSVPMGQGTINASYVRSDLKGGTVGANDATQIALGYQYALSKRTTIYGTGSRLDNKGAGRLTIGGGPAGFIPNAGRNSTGIEAGIRHTF